jgi:HD-GYP domain-containing protein (c-di-GMP phosphodiesterase class II)
MPRSLRLSLAIAAVAPLALFIVAHAVLTGSYELPTVHLFAVGGCAALAAACSILITRTSIARNDLRGGLVGVAFTAMAGLLTIHGLSTPGVFLGEYGRNVVVGLTGAIAVPVGGALLALAVLAPPTLPNGRALIGRAQFVTIAVLIVLGAVGLTRPGLLPEIPLTVHPWVFAVLFPTAAVYAWAARRVYRIHQLTNRRADAWVAIGLVWLGCSIFLFLLSPVWSIGFWSSHMLEGLGVVAISGAIAVDLTRQAPSLQLHRKITGRDLIDSEESLLGGYVRSLTAAMEVRDPSTREHSRRVAQWAVDVGEQLELPPATVRRLAISALVHDIGKLQVPQDILNKPGKLTDEEFEIIQTHPSAGAELLGRLGGFDAEIPIVRAHHERFTGGGYPDNLSGDQIPLEARILMVCDVYDALTSPRVYRREPWTSERAVELLQKESGTTFDPQCVDALLGVLAAREPVEVLVLRSTAGPAAAPRPAEA